MVRDFPYQRSGVVGGIDWKAVVADKNMAVGEFEDEYFPADEQSLFDERFSQKLEEGTLVSKRARRRKVLLKRWQHVDWARPTQVYGFDEEQGKFLFDLYNKIEPTDIT